MRKALKLQGCSGSRSLWDTEVVFSIFLIQVAFCWHHSWAGCTASVFSVSLLARFNPQAVLYCLLVASSIFHLQLGKREDLVFSNLRPTQSYPKVCLASTSVNHSVRGGGTCLRTQRLKQAPLPATGRKQPTCSPRTVSARSWKHLSCIMTSFLKRFQIVMIFL